LVEIQRRRSRRLTATIVTGAAAAVLAISPLGGAGTGAVGGFSDWLIGTPGTPTSPALQRQFDTSSPFPGNPRLRELLNVTLDGRRFVLYGFETGQVVCLRVAVRGLADAGPQAACVSRVDLRRSRDLALPVKANLSVAQYVLTFGVLVHEVVSVVVRTDRGTSRAAVRDGAFLDVFRSGRRGDWARAVVARTATRRTDVVPLSVQASREPPLRTGLGPQGPSKINRTVSGARIGWFVHRESRGLSSAQAHLKIQGCCRGYARVIQPDPDDFLRVLISDRFTSPIPRRVPLPTRGEHRICFGALTRGGFGQSCTTLENLFRAGPVALSWGFSGAGQQLWLVEGTRERRRHADRDLSRYGPALACAAS
jgi:hypothetical protein